MASSAFWPYMQPKSCNQAIKACHAFLWSTFGIYITVYIDDTLIQAKTKSEAYLHSQITILVLLCLGWEIKRDKSNLIQSHEITHIGFCINTNSMTATLPGDKISSFERFCINYLE